jgi:hypothetical protein
LAAVFVALTVVIGPVDVTKPSWLEGDSGGGPPTDPVDARPVEEEFPNFLSTSPEPDSSNLDLPFAQIFLALAAALAAWIGYVLYRQIRQVKRRASGIIGGDVTIDETAEDLRKAAEEAGDTLNRKDVPASDAIIQAWLMLERAAKDSGAPRGAAQTPSEFTAALLRQHRATPDAVQRLLTVYEFARFSTHPDLTETDVATAREALRDIMQSLVNTKATATTEERA